MMKKKCSIYVIIGWIVLVAPSILFVARNLNALKQIDLQTNEDDSSLSVSSSNSPEPIFASQIKLTDANEYNIVFILTDDQDLMLAGYHGLNKTVDLLKTVNEQPDDNPVRSRMFTNAFVNSPVCCVSRASILTGRYPHNSKTLTNRNGCGAAYWINHMEPHTLGPYLKTRGYATFYAGKYLNFYPTKERPKIKPTNVPVGWDHWYGMHGNSNYYNYGITTRIVNESKEQHTRAGFDYETDYLTDNIKRQALLFLDKQAQRDEKKPFVMVLSTPAAHEPFVPAPQYKGTLPKSFKVPRSVSFDASDEGNLCKSSVVRYNNKKLSQSEIDFIDATHRLRVETMMSVDDMIIDVYEKIKSMDELHKTYFLFYSDHGFHLGQFGFLMDKRLLYETDLRVPAFIIGPNLKAPGDDFDTFISAIDIVPTLVDLAVGEVDPQMDGMSMKPYLIRNAGTDRLLHDEKRIAQQQQFYVEYYGMGNTYDKLDAAASFTTKEKKRLYKNAKNITLRLQDNVDNTYHCVRMINESMSNGIIFCIFECFDKQSKNTACKAGTPEAKGEYYELDADPWNYKNQWDKLSPDEINYFANLVDRFHQCQGSDECNQLRFGKIPIGSEYQRKSKFFSFWRNNNAMGSTVV